ncbi:MAG: hypothetical protein ABL955_12920, partial [Elusimicrobiota bacterium]
MDVLLRLRVLIWILVISLWGVMVYQYLGEEEKDMAKMKRIAPYVAAQHVPESADAAMKPMEPAAYAPAALPPSVPQTLPPVTSPQALPVNPPASDTGLNVIPSSEYIGAAPSTSRRTVAANPAIAPVAPAAPPASRARATLSREDRTAPADMPTPP